MAKIYPIRYLLAGHLLLLFIILSLDGFAQQAQRITGRVTAADDENPLAGVTVRIKDTQTGTITNDKGIFTIQAAKGATLVFTYTGFAQKEVVVGDASNLDIKLDMANTSLQETVVIGYGSQRKRDITSAISNVDLSKLQDVPVSNASRLLNGQASGVVAKQPSGRPGLEFQVKIRGESSLGANSNPLYVVDGFPVGNSIESLNPHDIESITVLKDAASSAIYGARGANGVVLITTKTAKEGQSHLTFTSNTSIANVPKARRLKMMNGVEFAQLKKEIFIDKIKYTENREPDISEIPEDYRFPEQTKISTDWYGACLQPNALTQDYNITLRNESRKVRSFLSLGYYNEEGAVIYNNFKRYSARANIEGNLTEAIKLGANLYGNFTQSRLQLDLSIFDGPYSTKILSRAYFMDPREPIYNEDGSFKPYGGLHDGIFGNMNVVHYLTDIDPKRAGTDVAAQGFAEIAFLKYFKFRSNFNVMLNNSNYKEFHPSYVADYSITNPPPVIATLAQSNSNLLNVSADQLLTFSRQTGSHSFDVLLGYTAQREIGQELAGNGTGFADDRTPFLQEAKLQTTSSSETEWTSLAYFTRLSYSYADRYLLSASFRREGSSRFGAKSKWGNFPSVSAGWRITDESFMPDLSWLSDLKLRGSWGLTGNNNIGNYSSLVSMVTKNYVLNNNLANGSVIGAFPNAALEWEKSNQLNVGLDLALFKGKFTLTAEYYRKITKDMLLPAPLPSIAGFTTVLTNIGKVQNKGWEFTAGYRTDLNKVHLNANFNIAFNRNKVLELNTSNDRIYGPTGLETFNVSMVGQPIAMFWGFDWLGIFNSQAEIDNAPHGSGNLPGTFRYRDVNNDGKITLDNNDKTIIGNPHPKFTWGLNLGGNYQAFDLTILFTGMQHYDVFWKTESNFTIADGTRNAMKEVKDRWRSEDNPGSGRNPGTLTPNFTHDVSNRYIYDASHLWLRDVSLGYTIPKFKTSVISNLRVNISAENLFILSNYPGNQPEIDAYDRTTSIGVDYESFPIPRKFSIGVSMSLF